MVTAHHHAELEQLYREHGHLVVRRARQLLGSNEDALDALQEVFMSLASRPNQVTKSGAALTTWLYSATTHLCLNRLRDRRTQERLFNERLKHAEASEETPNIDKFIDARLLLAQLPDEVAQAMAYYCFDDLSYDEIAEVMKCSRRHVGNLLGRARAWAATNEATA